MKTKENGISKKLVRIFSKNFISPRKKTTRKIGLECEFPVVFESGEAVSYDIIRKMFQYLEMKGFLLHKDEGTGEIVAADFAMSMGKGRFGYKKDTIGTDVGYCTVEVSFSPEENLMLLESHVKQVINLLVGYFSRHKCRILGYGVQPLTKPNKSLLANKGRYIFFEQDSLNRFIDPHDGVDLHVFTTSAANQVHIDIYRDEAIRAVNVLNGLAGLQIAFGVNAPIWKGRVDEQWKAIREIFWDYGWTNRLDQIGIPKKFKDYSDYVAYISSFRPLMVKRQGEYIKILGRKTFLEFLTNKSSVGLRVNGNNVLLRPNLNDIHFQAGFAWFDARLAPAYGTLEARVCCQQPPGETLIVPAFVLGVVENLEKAEKLLGQFRWTEWQKLRFEALRHALSSCIGEKEVLPMVNELVDIAEKGLNKRKLGEEKYLVPLKIRLKDKKSPADRAIDIFKTKGLSGVLNALSFT